RLLPVVRDADLVPRRGQFDLEEPSDERIVVHHEQLLPARVRPAFNLAHVDSHIFGSSPSDRRARAPPTHRQLTVPTWRGRGSAGRDGCTGVVGRWVPRST